MDLGMLRRQIADLPGELHIWRAGPLAIRTVLMHVATRRMLEVGKATMKTGFPPVHEAQAEWTHVVSTLLEWHAKYAVDVGRGPVDEAAVSEAIALALDWRRLETILVGLATGDLVVSSWSGGVVSVRNTRRAGVEVLDIVLAQVTIPPPAPSFEDFAVVRDWFEQRQGRQDLVNSVPLWIRGLMWTRAEELLRAQGLTVSEGTDLGGLTLSEARTCYAGLLSTCDLNLICTLELRSPQSLLWFIRPAALIEMLRMRVSKSVAEAFVQLCLFRPGRSPVSAPLIPSADMLMIPADLISATAFERTLLRASAADPSRAGTLGNVLGNRAGRWIERLSTIPGSFVFDRVTVHDSAGKVLGDLDVVGYDPADNFMVVFETKWPIDAATLSESNKVDATFDAGRRQLRRLVAAIQTGGANARWPSGVEVPSTVDTRWWVGSAQQLDSRLPDEDKTIGTTSLRLVEHLLPCASLRELDDRLRNPPLAVEGRDFELVEDSVRVGEFSVRFPMIALAPGMPTPPADRRVHRGWT